MAGSVNKVLLIGNLGGAPEIRRTADGKAVVNLSIATSETWRDKSTGERKEKTEWHRVVIWNEGLCKIAEQYLSKGSKVYIEGALQTRKWQDKDGSDRYTTEIVGSEMKMLGGKSDGEQRQAPQADRPQAQSQSAPAKKNPTFDDMDDDIPF